MINSGLRGSARSPGRCQWAVPSSFFMTGNHGVREWRAFLERWSAEWWAVSDAGERERVLPEGGGWLGFAPAPEEAVLALEERVGQPLPPSYRSFLAVTDGWRQAGHFVYRLAGARELGPSEDAPFMVDLFTDLLPERPSPEDLHTIGMWGRSYGLALDSDAVHVLFDPGEVGEDGEWPVYTWASWRAAEPRRYASFRHFMRAMHQEFHSMSVSGKGIETDTAREQDARLAEGCDLALRGETERARPLLQEAAAYGRPGAAYARAQVDAFLRGRSQEEPAAAESAQALALNAMAYFHSRPSATVADAAFLLFGLEGEERDRGLALLGAVAAGTSAYAEPDLVGADPHGAFATAVREARALSFWGRTREAWDTLYAALPAWEPPGAQDVAPVGLLTDPLLAPLFERVLGRVPPGRGHAFLATPRGGLPVRQAVPATVAPEGLSWLVDDERFQPRFSRFVLAGGISPEELARRLGTPEPSGGPDDGDGVIAGATFDAGPGRRGARVPPPGELGPPADSRIIHRSGQPGEGPVFQVGDCGKGWSFAIAGGRADFVAPEDSSGLPAALSAGARVLTVTVGDRDAYDVSCFGDGVERYGVTVDEHRRGEPGTISGRGELPAGITAGAGLRTLLDALTRLYGASLPEDAIRRGRLPYVVSRPWQCPRRADGQRLFFVRHRGPHAVEDAEESHERLHAAAAAKVRPDPGPQRHPVREPDDPGAPGSRPRPTS